MKKNKAKQILKEGGICFGTMIRIVKAVDIIPLCAAVGWDYIILDTEHCECDPETLGNLALAAKYEDLTFLVRVPDKLYHQTAQVLDYGAEGLIFPRLETRAQAEQIVQSAKYFPIGSRGASISHKMTLFRPTTATEYMQWCNDETLLVVQIESTEAVDRIDDLLSVEHLDAVMIGPFDLSQSLGIPGQMTHPKMAEAYQKVIESCERNGVAPGIHLNDLDQVDLWVKRGMRFVTYKYDTRFLEEASHQALGSLREIAGGK